ncbi:hypothetical protein GE21DRAFT_6321 [Neurospora crassa]|uniref:Fungal calcium binding protein domain-containing protein n=1 Tax=Neurospora crassa (strain ATCC 24698 / 74-OR23-1A / CBS 708.71 / DSM 1257 / FGSC 987) TaxID=367110 RepID=Q7S8P6_NEUCR|nr:hypothetical protein NCU08657 [Neurospora crassa OR74A]EAA32722.1 hypothetical protein NCU08657 [Neurospora crassa OR74A]KHE82824.1 hypothetical protein GE21DRAFT_6321 [Neurospora crassa]|eukprot:XP_961958.1 hypothetical protein NCU08657 [Neurospora crassa OR74A]
MFFTTVLTSALAGLAMASPTARMDQSTNGLEQRQILPTQCLVNCLTVVCTANPLACSGCLLSCLNLAANDAGEVVLNAIALEKAVGDKVEGYVPQTTTKA